MLIDNQILPKYCNSWLLSRRGAASTSPLECAAESHIPPPAKYQHDPNTCSVSAFLLGNNETHKAYVASFFFVFFWRISFQLFVAQSLSVPGAYWLADFFDVACDHLDRDCQWSTHLSFQANAITGCLLARVTHHTQAIHLLVSSNNVEQIQFHVISSANSPFVPGQPWLNPLIGPQEKCWVGVHIPFCSALSPCILLKLPAAYNYFRGVLNTHHVKLLQPHCNSTIAFLPSDSSASQLIL